MLPSTNIVVTCSVIQVLAILPTCLLYALLAIWAERKVSAFIQDRLGPMEVGYKGLLQTFADILKLFQKEDIVASANFKFIFKLAPFIIFVSVFVAFAVFPLAPGSVASDLSIGLYFLLAILSIDIIGFLLAAWGSNNKFSLIAGMRTVAQMISYEIPMALILLSVVMFCGSMSLVEISAQQSLGTEATLFGLNLGNFGGFMTWNIVKYPLLFIGFLIFSICALAESNRAPFDHVEAESEIIAGLLTEYSGFRFSIIALSEYIMMFLMGFLLAVLFFGAYNSPLPNFGFLKLNTWTSGEYGTFSGYFWGYFWLVGKSIIWVFVSMWVRWTYPRVRIDQLMHMSWKVLTPASMIFVLITGIYKLLTL